MHERATEAGTPASDRVRQRILAAVTRLIASDGIDGMTMRRVAEESGFSTGTVNYHFKNKRSLVIAALEDVYRAPLESFEGAGDAAAQLRSLTRNFILDRRATRDWWQFWTQYSARAARDADLRHHQGERFSRQLAYYRRLMEAGVARGELPPDLDPALSASALLSLAYGLAMRQVIDPAPETVAEAQRTLDSVIAALAG